MAKAMNIYSAESLAKALDKASRELNIPKEELNYKVIKKTKSFFKQFIEIEIISNQEQPAAKEKEPLVGNLPRVHKQIVDNKKILRVEVSRDKLEAYIALEYEEEASSSSAEIPTDDNIFSEELTSGDLLQLIKEKITNTG